MSQASGGGDPASAGAGQGPPGRLIGALLGRWSERPLAERALVSNSAFMVAATVVMTTLGYAYWWLAARLYPPEALGVAAAAVSAMNLLATVGVLGMGTLLVGEIPRRPIGKRGLAIAAIAVAATATAGLCTLMLAANLLLDSDLRILSFSGVGVILFAVGGAATAAASVADKATIGLLRGYLQLGRAGLFALGKLAALALAGLWLADRGDLAILGSWVVGTLMSLGGLLGLTALVRVPIRPARPDWLTLRSLHRSAVAHHVLNITTQGPTLLMPVLATVLVSAALNAPFYVAQMVAVLVWIGPSSLATALFAVGKGEPGAFVPRLRLSLALSMVVGSAACLVCLSGAEMILGLFGPLYANQGAWCLRALAVGVYPGILTQHYVALCRVGGRLSEALRLTAVGAAVQVASATAGGMAGGLNGLAAGWLAGMCIEAAMTIPALHRAARAGRRGGRAVRG